MKKQTIIQNGLLFFLAIGIVGVFLYGINKSLPTQLYTQNCNRQLMSTTSIWWNPINSDYPYADLVVHSLSKGKTIRMGEENPYLSYFISLTANVVVENEVKEGIAEHVYTYVGKSNFYVNDLFLDEDTFRLLMEDNCIVDIYADVSSLRSYNYIRLAVDEIGDIYLYGEE